MVTSFRVPVADTGAMRNPTFAALGSAVIAFAATAALAQEQPGEDPVAAALAAREKQMVGIRRAERAMSKGIDKVGLPPGAEALAGGSALDELVKSGEAPAAIADDEEYVEEPATPVKKKTNLLKILAGAKVWQYAIVGGALVFLIWTVKRTVGMLRGD